MLAMCCSVPANSLIGCGRSPFRGSVVGSKAHRMIAHAKSDRSFGYRVASCFMFKIPCLLNSIKAANAATRTSGTSVLFDTHPKIHDRRISVILPQQHHDSDQGTASLESRRRRHDPSWIQRLTPEEATGFNTALAYAKRALKPLLAMQQSDFPLPAASRRVLEKAIEATQGWWGMILLKGSPTDDLSEEDMRLAYWGMSLFMGVGRTQNKASEVINDVRDTGGSYYVKGGRGYNTNVQLDFHQDYTDVGMYLSPPTLDVITTLTNPSKSHFYVAVLLNLAGQAKSLVPLRCAKPCNGSAQILCLHWKATSSFTATKAPRIHLNHLTTAAQSSALGPAHPLRERMRSRCLFRSNPFDEAINKFMRRVAGPGRFASASNVAHHSRIRDSCPLGPIIIFTAPGFGGSLIFQKSIIVSNFAGFSF
jgi:hypothetical protein